MAHNPVYLLGTCANRPIQNPIFSDADLAAAGVPRIGQEITMEKSPELALMLAIMCALSEPQKELVRKNLDILTRVGSAEASAALQVVGASKDNLHRATVELIGMAI